jgi:L-ascorbate metabolism protein UlaG (beta-lactamase superfamily)
MTLWGRDQGPGVESSSGTKAFPMGLFAGTLAYVPIRFVSHSSLLCTDDDGDLLMDPWLFGDVFHESWSLLAPPDLDTLDLRGLRYVWISHTHPDHFHVPSLRWVRDQVDGPLTAFIRHSQNPTLRETLTGLGFEVVELSELRTHRVSDNLSITTLSHAHDSSLVIEHDGRVILNQNDCPLDDEQISQVLHRFPSIDAWFYQFSIGGYFANADDLETLETTRQNFVDRIGRYAEQLQPTMFVPFASFVRYVKEASAYMNDHVMLPDALAAALPHVPVQVLWAGDELLWSDWDDRNLVNYQRWRTAFNTPLDHLKPPSSIDEADLLAAGLSLVKSAPVGIGPGEIHVELTDTGRVVTIDFWRRRFDIHDNADPDEIDCRMAAEALLHFCTSPYGADIHIGGCVHVVDPIAWHLLRFKHSLEPGETDSRRSVWRTRLRRTDQEVLGGKLAKLVRRLRLVRARRFSTV